MALGLAFATSKECQAALGGLGFAGLKGPGWAEWKRGRREYFVLVSGVGPLNAAIGLAGLLKREELEGVLNLGVAGTFDLGQAALGSTALVSAEKWPEYGLASPEGVNPRGIGFSLWKDEAGEVWNELGFAPRKQALALGLSPDEAWPELKSLTVSAASGYPELAARLKNEHAAVLENMEGFAFGLACRRAGVDFVELRTVSNLVGSRDKGAWDLAGALRALGQATRNMLG